MGIRANQETFPIMPIGTLPAKPRLAQFHNRFQLRFHLTENIRYRDENVLIRAKKVVKDAPLATSLSRFHRTQFLWHFQNRDKTVEF
jgi:hypothetical protein